MTLVAVLILAVVSGWVILSLIQTQTASAKEKTQVDLCKISNEIGAGIQEKTAGYFPGLRVCSTIDKTTKERQVPTKKYSQNKEGAEAEVREMIKNCWYMYFDGSRPNVFLELPQAESCYICYIFEIERGVEGFTIDSIRNSMDAPYFAVDRSDKCAPNGGFYNPPFGEEEGWREVQSSKALAEEEKCYVRPGGILNECENKGGFCLPNKEDLQKPSEYTKAYDKWNCPGKSRCYVKDGDYFTYTKYITEFGAMGGDVYFLPTGDKDVDPFEASYGKEEVYAITFVSPSKQNCDGFFCKFNPAQSYSGSFSPGKKIAGLVPGGKNSLRLLQEKINPWDKDVPNLLLVSSFEHARDLGCDYDLR